MLSPRDVESIKESLKYCASESIDFLDTLQKEIASVKSDVRSIKPRNTTAVSLVASDGGNNQLHFDPFLFQLVRVVDSHGKIHCLETVAPTSNIADLSKKQFSDPPTALGKMMTDLGCKDLHELSHMIPDKVSEDPFDPQSTRWVEVYRDLHEWAVLYERIVYSSFASGTLLIRDGLLRSKIFRGDYFNSLRKKIEDAIQRNKAENKIDLFLVGLAKRSKVLDRYKLTISIESLFPTGNPYYVRIPRELEAKAYLWDSYAVGPESNEDTGRTPKFVAGDMYFVRFGKHSGDPIWIVDIFSSQSASDDEIFGHLLMDAMNGFPVPYYPLALQKAHEYAQITEFDSEIFQDEIIKAIRKEIPEDRRSGFDAQCLNTVDKSKFRYL